VKGGKQIHLAAWTTACLWYWLEVAQTSVTWNEKWLSGKNFWHRMPEGEKQSG